MKKTFMITLLQVSITQEGVIATFMVTGTKQDYFSLKIGQSMLIEGDENTRFYPHEPKQMKGSK